ncbi:UNVERIFIED_CONTAM: hypothetical protein PYX00_010890 [Menopon gallinae]|uniref:Uncharacterized protein n=1 Tax=Menopon gallinae TaxID=328185 RepID=A0AAW2H6L6_9NEOP
MTARTMSKIKVPTSFSSNSLMYRAKMIASKKREPCRAGGEEQERYKEEDKGSSNFGEYGDLIKQKSQQGSEGVKNTGENRGENIKDTNMGIIGNTMKSGAKSAFAKKKDAASSIKNKFSKVPEDKK